MLRFMKMVKCSPEFEYFFTVFLKNRNCISKIRRSKVTDYAALNVLMYTIHNKFSYFLCFASLCAHLCAISNNFNCNDENRILGK